MQGDQAEPLLALNLVGESEHNGFPKGSIYPNSIYTWAPKYLHRDYFKAKVYTIYPYTLNPYGTYGTLEAYPKRHPSYSMFILFGHMDP